jgi:hypothetical protein
MPTSIIVPSKDAAGNGIPSAGPEPLLARVEIAVVFV